MDKITRDQPLRVLHFLLEDTRLCIDLQYLDKILPLVLLEPVPNSPAYVTGLLNLAGKTIPVIDLAIRLGMQRSTPYSVDVPILLCSYQTYQACFVVDHILEMEQVDPMSLQMHDDFDNPDSFFCGAIAANENMSLLIDISRILPIEINNEVPNSMRKSPQVKPIADNKEI